MQSSSDVVKVMSQVNVFTSLLFFNVCITTATVPVEQFENNATARFPIEQFENITVEESSRKLFDRFLCTSNEQERYCDCDDSCVFYRTCCVDKLWNRQTMWNGEAMQSYRKLLLRDLPSGRVMYKPNECEGAFPIGLNRADRIPNGLNRTYRIPIGLNRAYWSLSACTNHYLMVSACRVNASLEDKRKCSNVRMFECSNAKCSNAKNTSLQSSQPVLGDDNYVYKNSFCANCNHVQSFRLMNMSARCKNFPIKAHVSHNFQNCNFSLMGSPTVRTCSPGDPLKCSNKSKLFDLCRKYEGSVIERGNIYCHLCDTSEPKSSNNCNQENIHDLYLWRINFTFSLSWQVHIRKGDSGQVITRALCNNNSVYDILLGVCRDVTCPSGYKVKGSKCMRNSHGGKGENSGLFADFDKCFLSQPNKFISINNLRKPSNLLQLIFSRMEISDTVVDKAWFYNNTETIIIKVSKSKNNKTARKVTSRFPNKILVEKLKKLPLQPSDYPSLSIYTDLPATSNTTDCIRILVNVSSARFTNSCDVLINQNLIKRSNVSMWFLFYNSTASRYISTCEHYILNCHLDVLTTNVTLDDKNNLIHRTNGGESVYSVREYIPLANGFGVCTRDTDWQHETSTTNWPFTVFMIFLICLLFFYFFRTICYKNQGYIRTYYVKSATTFIKGTTYR